MKLIMHGEGYPCQTLPASDGYIDTDYMGDCMSALVFTDEHDGTYRDVRGYHGLGGLEVVNWKSLLANIPILQPMKLYIVGPGCLCSANRRKQTEQMVETALSESGLRAVEVCYFYEKSRMVFDRTATQVDPEAPGGGCCPIL